MGGLGASAAFEPLATAARGIVVSWGGAKALLVLVMTAKPELHECAGEEEEGPNDRNRESCGVQPTGKAKGDGVGAIMAAGGTVGICGASANRRCDTIACAAAGPIASENCETNEGSAKKNVQNNAEKCEEGDAAKEAS